MKLTAVPKVSPTEISFTLKGGLFPLTLFELRDYNKDNLRKELAKKTAEAPGFFHQTPTILSIERYQNDQDKINLYELRAVCHEFGLILGTLRGGDDTLKQKALELGMGLLPASRKKKESSSSKPEKDEATSQTESNNTIQASKIITTPIRSGQQIYATGGDLIVMAPVSAGAEILADGNIHVYGPMRGRVLAGVQGNTSARVFCQSLEAELISIAGHFTTDEDPHSQHWKQAVQIHLEGKSLRVEPLLFSQSRKM